MIKEKDNNILEKNYLEDLNKIKETIRTNQAKAMVVVNQAMIMTYYQIGTIINKRKHWGNKFIERLSNDLKEYGKGYSVRNLKYMSKFANDFSSNEIMQQPAAQIPWFTLIEIMTKSNTHEEMLWYINETYQNSWSRSMLLNQFKLQAYQRSLIEPTTSPVMKKDTCINELFKDTYVFDFLNQKNIKTEADLKNHMIEHIIQFLQELGPGFSLVGKEYRLLTPTNKSFYIDLLMYHTKIHAYIVIEVKMNEFMPSDFGQLSFYVSAIDELEKTDKDEPTIGLLLCKEADSFVAQTTLKNTYNKVGISKYKWVDDLPSYLENKLKQIK